MQIVRDERLALARLLQPLGVLQSTYPQTTRERPISVLARSFSAGLTHASRRTLELAAAFADRYQMDFRFTYFR